MHARMSNPATTVPGAMKALLALSKSAENDGLPAATRDLVPESAASWDRPAWPSTASPSLRASQINGCSVCVDMHARDLRKAGESDERIFAEAAAWRDAPYFTGAEWAALALTEAATPAE